MCVGKSDLPIAKTLDNATVPGDAKVIRSGICELVSLKPRYELEQPCVVVKIGFVAKRERLKKVTN